MRCLTRGVRLMLAALLAAMYGWPAAAQSAPPAAPDSILIAVTFTTGPAWDAGKPPQEQSGFKEHSQNLFRLRREGRIVAGGRFGAYGLMLVRAVNEDDARSLFASDPTIATGVFVAKFDRWYTVFDGSVPGT